MKMSEEGEAKVFPLQGMEVTHLRASSLRNTEPKHYDRSQVQKCK